MTTTLEPVGSLCLRLLFLLLLLQFPVLAQPQVLANPNTAFTGFPYSYQLNITGGTPPYTVAVTGGELPDGIGVSSTGLVSGTPTEWFQFDFQVTVTDSEGLTGVRNTHIYVTPPPLPVFPETIPDGDLGEPYSAMFSSSGGQPPYRFRYSPRISGLSMDPDTGVLSGTPAQSGEFTFTVSVFDDGSEERTGKRVYTINISGTNALVLNPLSLPEKLVGQPYDEYVFVTGPDGAQNPTWTITSGSLPPGITLDSSLNDRVKFAGIPTQAGTFPFRLKVQDALGNTSSWDYSITIAEQDLQISPSSLPDGQKGVPYSATFGASGGTPPYIYSADQWPSDFSVSNSVSPQGSLYYTRHGQGESQFRITATDSNGLTGYHFYTLYLQPTTLTIQAQAMPGGVGVPFNYSLTTFGGVPPYSYSVVDGALPPGVHLASNGQFSGAPTAGGNFSFRVMSTDSTAAVGTRDFNTFVGGGTVSITLGPSTLPDAHGGEPYFAQITASGGTPPYTFTMPEGQWVVGMTVNPDGTITGTPPDGLNVELLPLIRATDANNVWGDREFSIQLVSSVVVITLPPGPIPEGRVGEPYAGFTVMAAGGQAPYTYTPTGDLPPGISLSPAGVISGTPTEEGFFPIAFQITDANGEERPGGYQLHVLPPPPLQLSPHSMPPAMEGEAYSVALQASAGTPPYAYAVTEGELPDGLALQGNIISGVPTHPNLPFFFTITVTDSMGKSTEFTFRITAAPIPRIISPAALPDAVLGEPYHAAFTLTNGEPPFSFFGSPGGGLSTNQAGEVSGIPTGSLGPRPFELTVIDGYGVITEQVIELKVVAPAIELQPELLPEAEEHQFYSVSFMALGGSPPYTFSKTPGGFIPPDMSLSEAGVFSGTPTARGTYSLNVTVQDSGGASTVRNLTFRVNTPSHVLITVTPLVLNAAGMGDPYSVNLAATGGRGPYTFSVVAGSLPPGLSLSGDGLLDGTPLQTGVFNPRIRATDQDGETGERTYTLSVLSSDVTAIHIDTTLGSVQQGTPFSQQLTATGGDPPYAWIVQSGSLPPGLTLSPQGLLSGNPSESGEFSFTLHVSDANEGEAIANFLMTVTANPGGNTLSVDPASLQFNLKQGDPPATSCIAALTTSGPAQVSAVLDGGNWAGLDGNQLETPGFFCITVDPAGVSPGIYEDALRLLGTNVEPAEVIVPIMFNLFPPVSESLHIAPEELLVTRSLNDAPLARTLVLHNPGSESRSFSVTVPGDPSHAGWLSVDPVPESIAGGGTVSIGLRFDPSGLAADVYSSQVIVVSGEQTITVPVELVVESHPGQLSFSQSALALLGWSGGASVSTSVGVINESGTALDPGLSGITLSGMTDDGADWMTLGTFPSTLNANSAQPLEIAVNPGSLTPGTYTGTVFLGTVGSGMAPAALSLEFTVLPPDAPVPPDAPLSGLFLTPFAPVGEIEFLRPAAPGLSFSAVSQTGAEDWLVLSPVSGDLPADSSMEIAASALWEGLAAGLYTGSVAVGLSDGTGQTAPVGLFVPAAPLPASVATLRRPVSQVCETGEEIVPFLVSPVPNFVARQGRPVTVRVRLVDCAGQWLSGAEVLAMAGDTQFSLRAEAPGSYAATWLPGVDPDQALRVRATKGTSVSPEAVVQGTVISSSTGVPVVGQVVHAATQVSSGPLAPGAWITIYGAGLAEEEALPTSVSLPTELSGVSVRLGDIALPLYYVSAAQINAVLPFDLEAPASSNLTVTRGGISSNPVPVTIARTSPGVFTLNQQGSGQAAALVAGSTQLAGPSSPISRGEYLELYATGLGEVQNAPVSGAPASMDSLSPVVAPISVTIGGVPAEVVFAGLTPGALHLYQINVLIPGDALIGESIPVIVTQGSRSSPPVTVSIR